MSIATAQYPGAVWDRSTKGRGTDPQLNREPNFQDYDQQVAEIRAIETDLTHGLNSKNVATNSPSNVLGSIPVVFTINSPNSAGNISLVVTDKIKIFDVTIYKTNGDGGAGDHIQLKNGSNAISDEMSLNNYNHRTVRAAYIDDTYNVIAAGGTLTIVVGKDADSRAVVSILAVLVP